MIFKYEVEIQIDEKNIKQKYPNFQINYENSKDFADSILFSLKTENLEDGENGLKKWGYKVKVKENKDFKNREKIIAALDYVGFALTDNMQSESIILYAVIDALKSGNYDSLKQSLDEI